MFAIFSLIKDVPQIYQIHIHEETCKKSLQELVHKFIIQKRNFENPDPLTLPLSEIKLNTFSQYPNYTYLTLDSNTIEIYEHQMVDVVEKGWVWNGLTKSVSSLKIGYFQIQSVREKDMIEPEMTIEEINEEQLKMYQDIENLIDEMLRSIEKGNEDLEKEKERIKNLPDLVSITENAGDLPKEPLYKILPYSSENKVEPILPIIQTSKPIDIVPLVSPNHPLKKNPLAIETKYLSFFDEEDEPKEQQKEQEKAKEEQEQIDLCDDHTYPRYNWTQRGKRSNRYSSRRRGYVASNGYSQGKLHLY
jgi:hypothetical protein